MAGGGVSGQPKNHPGYATATHNSSIQWHRDVRRDKLPHRGLRSRKGSHFVTSIIILSGNEYLQYYCNNMTFLMPLHYKFIPKIPTRSLFRSNVSGHCCLDGSSIHQPIFCCSSHSPNTCLHPVLHILLPRSFFGLPLLLWSFTFRSSIWCHFICPK